MSTMSTSGFPKLLEPKRKVYIKDGQRKIATDGGYMHMPMTLSRRTFGRLKGGRYSIPQ